MKTKTVEAKANAKVNLTFEILGILDGGYHEVKTLLQSVDLVDKLTLQIKESSRAKIYISGYKSKVAGEFPMDESNLAVKACDRYLAHIGEVEKFEIKIKIEKAIPIQAGLAGGSANAAAALVAINEAFENRLNESELLDLGSELGADIPFCIKGGTCLGTVKGDRLETINNNNKLYMILVKPRFLSVSTPMLFKLYDQYIKEQAEKEFPTELAELLNSSKTISKQDILINCFSLLKGKKQGSQTSKAKSSCENGNLESFFESLTNDFENVIYDLYPELELIKNKLLEFGCWTANLTGSGPTLYGTLPDIEKANLIQRKLIADKLNNPKSPYYKHGPLDHFVVASSSTSAQVI